MAGPVANKIILPLDTANTGKNIRTQTRVVGSDTVHEHFFVKNRQASILGVYRLAMAQQSVLETAHDGTTTGFLWLHVPIGTSGKKVRIRKIIVESKSSSALVTLTAPRIVVSRITFTGTASGAQLTPVKNDSTYAAPIADLRTAYTGLAVTLIGSLASAGICNALTAVGESAYGPFELINSPEEDDYVVLASGEGISLWQELNGTASDTRKLGITIVWDEIDTA